MAEQNILDKSMRSKTEEKLKNIFNEIGPVISFKSGDCTCAMRNLNRYEIRSRTLLVDNACTKKSKLEIQSLMMGMNTSESHNGDAVNAEKAPEIINNVVSTLPSEQSYELMKQMKEFIQNNPVEARNMLLQNSQLGYALLQAQVIMKIMDPEIARTMLYPAHKVSTPLRISKATTTTSRVQPVLLTNLIFNLIPIWHFVEMKLIVYKYGIFRHSVILAQVYFVGIRVGASFVALQGMQTNIFTNQNCVHADASYQIIEFNCKSEYLKKKLIYNYNANKLANEFINI
ncbi:hypothetical protein QTP88_028753 [Uroleucon formosanum]